MRATRIGLMLSTITLMLLATAPPAGPAGIPVPPVLTIDYQGTVYGDFAMAGNTVTTCPSQPGHHPVWLCRDALHRKGSGITAQNNGHPMAWVDVDGSTATYNSSSGRLMIPPGARIAYAALTWAGATGRPAGTSCARGTVRPPGSPREQALSVTVNGKTSSVRPGRYLEDIDLGPGDQRFYSARAELTGALRGMSGPLTVTVGNVWTPQGYNCFGGWSVLAVWAFDRAALPLAPARKQVTIYDGHIRLRAGELRETTRIPSIRPAGGPTRIGLTGFEGDWAISGDRFLANGHDPVPSANFFVSAAEGRLKPNYPNNMSVDVRTAEVAPWVIKAGDQSAGLTFTGGSDAYLVRGVAVATTMPELVATTRVDRAAVHPGDELVQTVTVTNTGDAPAVEIRMRAELSPACAHHVARLDPGRSATTTCTVTVGDTGPRPSAEVTGQSLTGDRLVARAQTTVDVLRPALSVAKTATPTTAIDGQTVRFEIVVGNSGNTTLSAVAVDDAHTSACDQEIGGLEPGESRTVRCSVAAGEDGVTGTVTATGMDRLGKRVSGAASARFSVVHPRITMTVVPSTNAVRPGQPVTLTVTVTNASPIPLGDVRVTGTPAACVRNLGTLTPGQVVVHTCRIVVEERLTTALTVSATPIIDGQPVTAFRNTIRGTATVIVSVVPPNPPPPTQPPAPAPVPARQAADVPRPSPVPVASLIAGLAVLSMFISMSGIAATASRPKR